MIADLVQFESIAELNPQPQSWSETTRAITAGAIDFDEIDPILRIAADRADEIELAAINYRDDAGNIRFDADFIHYRAEDRAWKKSVEGVHSESSAIRMRVKRP